MHKLLLASLVAFSIMLLAALSPAFAQDEASLSGGTTLNAVQALIDQPLADYTSVLNVLAQTSEVQSLEWEQMSTLLAYWAEETLPAAVWFALPDGTYYTVTDGLMDKNLSDRAYFPHLMAGEPICGSVVVSKSTGELSAIVAVPVYADGQLGGALGMSVEFSGWQENLGEALNLAQDEMAFVTGSDGAVLMRIYPHGTAGPVEAELNAVLDTANAAGGEHFPGTISFDSDGTWNFAYQTSELTYWRITIGSRK